MLTNRLRYVYNQGQHEPGLCRKFFFFVYLSLLTDTPKVTHQNLEGIGVAEGGEARICEQVPMGFRFLMVEKQEPAGTCPWSRLTPNDDFLLP
jgi:hypothetical protein